MIAVPLPPLADGAVPGGTRTRRKWPLVAAVAAGLLGLGLWGALKSPPDPPVIVPALRLDPPPKVLTAEAADAAGSGEVGLDAGSEAQTGSDEAADAPKKLKRHAPPPKSGHVTVRVNPWAEVFYNGKSYGMTPLKSPIDVPPGNVTFTLKNPQLGVNKKVVVKVPPGTDVVLKADLFKK